MTIVRANVFFVALLFVLLCGARAEVDFNSIRFDQNLGRSLPREAAFVDENGRHVTLGDYFGQKPLVIVPGYYRCPMLCTLVANGLIESLQELRLDIGRDFAVIHFSVDPRDTPADAAAKKHTYLTRYGRPGADAGWHFLTGDHSAVQRLADAIGFHYAYDPASQEYAHPSGFVIVTPDGKIARYFFGVNFDPHELRAALLDASAHKVGSPIEQLLLLCFHYNPVTGKYGLAILNILRACGLATVLGLAGFIFLAVKRERARRTLP